MDPVLKALRAAADGTRLRLLGVLTSGTFGVAELTEILGLGQSTVSKHVRVLADAGLVSVRRTGTWSLCSLADEGDGFAPRLVELLADRLAEARAGATPAIERVLARRRLDTSEFFRRTATHWDVVRDDVIGPPAHLDRLVELIGSGGTVVDLGTGTGVLLPRLAGASERVIGVDASPEMLDEARRHADHDGLDNTELRLGALEHLPLSDGEADVMVANLVLHHVADPPAVLREVRRGLRPDGRLVIAELAGHSDAAFWKRLGARWPGFRPAEMRAWLDAAGFRSVRSEPARPSDRRRSGDGRPDVFLMTATRSSVKHETPNPRRSDG